MSTLTIFKLVILAMVEPGFGKGGLGTNIAGDSPRRQKTTIY